MRLACLSTDRGIAYGGAKGVGHLAETVGASRRADVLLLVSGVAPTAAPPRR
jgi:hypothetical protein